MKKNRNLIFLAALGGLMVSSCGIDQTQDTDQSLDYSSYSYYEESSGSPITDVSHGEPTLEDLEFTLLEDGKSYAVGAKSENVSADIVIPATYEGLPVTKIKGMGFRGNKIRTLYIPEGVTAIEQEAIYWCENLQTLFIPSTVHSIAMWAIEDCPKLSITVSDKSTCFSSLNGALFDKNKTKIIRAPHYIESFVFPKTVTRIYPEAFFTCKNLKSIVIPEGVTSIGEAAFAGSGLVEVKISKTVESIDGRAFSHCESLKNVDFCYDGKSSESRLTNIWSEAFSWCRDLQEVKLPDHVKIVDEEAFEDCIDVKSLYLGKELVTIGKEAFNYMSSIKEVALPKTVESIGETPFEKCSELKSILVEEGNPYFSSFDGALYDKSKTTLIRCPEAKTSISFPNTLKNFEKAACRNAALTSVTIPNSVESLSKFAFDSCKSLATVTFPKTLTSIAELAFNECSALTSITIDSNIETIGRSAFSDCRSLISVEIKDGVSIVDYGAFDGCDSLTSISFPDSVEEVGYNCFWGCYALRSVAFGSGIKKIGGYAFAQCKALKTMTYNGTVEEWSEVDRGLAWLNNTPLTSVTCTDGEGITTDTMLMRS